MSDMIIENLNIKNERTKNEKLPIFPPFSIFLTLGIKFTSLDKEVLLPSTEFSFLTAALWWATPKPFWECVTHGSVLTVESVALHIATWSHEWTWLLQIRGMVLINTGSQPKLHIIRWREAGVLQLSAAEHLNHEKTLRCEPGGMGFGSNLREGERIHF